MPNIDIENPGGAAPALRAALLESIAPLAITITATGTPAEPFRVTPVQPAGAQINNTLYTAAGNWIEAFDYSTDASPLEGVQTLAFPDLVGVKNSFSLDTLSTLTSLEAPALVFVGGELGLESFNLLEELDLGALEFAGNLNFVSLTALVSLDLGALAAVNGPFFVDALPLPTALDLSALTTVRGISISTMDALITLDLSALTDVYGQVNFGGMPLLTSINLASIVSIHGQITLTSGVDAVTTFTLGAGLLLVDGDVTITSPTLSQASVDDVLVRLAALDGTGGTATYDGNYVDLSGNCAIPSATGLAAKATLEGRTNTVVVNS